MQVLTNSCTFLHNTPTTEQQNSTKQIFEAAGVQGTKLTHHRTHALQQLGFLGLMPHQINTLTNHLLDKQNRAYGSAAEYQVSKKCM